MKIIEVIKEMERLNHYLLKRYEAYAKRKIKKLEIPLELPAWIFKNCKGK